MVYKNYLNKIWYRKKLSYLYWPWIPISFIYDFIVRMREKLYQVGILKVYAKSPQLPVIVVGNLTVGGTGKTPCVIHIAQLLKQNGYKPGIVSRGYQGKHHRHQCIVGAHSYSEDSPYTNLGEVTWIEPEPNDKLLTDASYVGDEPLLMAKRLHCPVVVSRHRAKAVRALEQSNLVDVIISDDGLQHYAMARDIEIVLVDGLRRFGNGYCLPIGPLRESTSRLNKIDFTIANLSEGGIPGDNEYDMHYHLSDQLVSLVDFTGAEKINLSLNARDLQMTLDFLKSNSILVHAVAGLAHPSRFFNSLTSARIRLIPHAFPDHHAYTEQDLNFPDEHPILMTEKDAIKCLQFKNQALGRKIWVVKMDAFVSPLLDARLLLLLKEKIHG